MKHNDWVIFMRCMNWLGLTSGTALLIGGALNVWTVSLVVTCAAVALASLVADGHIGSWRERHDYEEYLRKVAENERIGRQLRRMRDMCEWEAKRHDA